MTLKTNQLGTMMTRETLYLFDLKLVKVGDRVTAHWTNCGNLWSATGIVKKLNRTTARVLIDDPENYMNGTEAVIQRVHGGLWSPNNCMAPLDVPATPAAPAVAEDNDARMTFDRNVEAIRHQLFPRQTAEDCHRDMGPSLDSAAL